MPFDRTWQIGLTLLGVGLLIAYFRSWKSARRILYDIPASIVMSGYVAQFMVDGLGGDRTGFWYIRLAAMVPLALVPVGRDILGWPISGHVLTMLAVPLIQMMDGRLSMVERGLYWIPFPIVLLMHWLIWDHEDYHGNTGHAQTVYAVLAGGLIGGAAGAGVWLWG